MRTRSAAGPILFLFLLAVAGPATHVWADTWCSTVHPGALFCDDFDRHCVDPPPAPQECSQTASPNNNSLRNVWGYTSLSCSDMLLEDAGFIVTEPFAARVPSDGLLTHRGVSLGSYCQTKFGAGINSVIATDLNPLYLEYIFDGKTGGKINYANSFMELSLGSQTTAHAATDYILSPNCGGCGGESTTYPIICQQAGAPSGCAPLNTAPHRPAIAVGAVSFLDTDPCECGGSMHQPYNSHLSFFDGFQWFKLRAGMFPGGGTNGPVPGDFLLRNRHNHVRLTVKSTTVKVELTCTDPNPDEYSWCEIPRDYLGSFNMMFIGSRIPCRLRSNSWECAAELKCVKGPPGAGVVVYENVVLKGGQGNIAPGVCCSANTSCSVMLYADCETLGGEFQGAGTTCATTPCCPFIEPDHDNDGDADLSDFGWFQTCLSGYGIPAATFACRCADFNDDSFVDQTDLGIFLDCASGQDIQATPGCDD